MVPKVCGTGYLQSALASCGILYGTYACGMAGLQRMFTWARFALCGSNPLWGVIRVMNQPRGGFAVH